MKTKVCQESNRDSPKSEKSSKQVKSHISSKPTTSNSRVAYFSFNREPKLPDETEEEIRVKRLLDREVEC